MPTAARPPMPPQPPGRGGMCRPRRRRGGRGFTLVELVIVMLLMAIVATVGMGRYADRQPFAVQALADQLVSGLRSAQAIAIAQRRTVHVRLTASPPALEVCLDAGCSQPLPPPGGDATWLTGTQELQLSASPTYSYAASGAPSFASVLAVQVQSTSGGATARSVTIEPVSGHVRVQ